MLLRGITLDGKSLLFNISDGPVLLNNNVIALTNVKDSPLLKSRSIVRGNEEFNIFESDFVFTEDNRFAGYVIYNCGFKLWIAETGTIIPLMRCGNLKFLENTGAKGFDVIDNLRSPINLKSGNIVFSINDIVRIEGDYITISNKSLKSFHLSSVRFVTGLTYNSKDICYGDISQDGIVTLQDNKPMVYVNGEYYRDFRKGEYDD